MSIRKEKYLTLANVDLQNETTAGLQALFRERLKLGVHGLCASPYEEGQKPGDQLSEKQIRRRLTVMRPYTHWIRSFSCTEGNELIPKIAKELGMKTMVGAWLGNDVIANKKELQGLVALAEAGLVDIAAVGNEVMYRGDLKEQELITHIKEARTHISNSIPIGYVDAYYEFVERPGITEVCDIILANCYPFWEGCEIDYSLLYIKDMYHRAYKAGKGKKVIIAETGWPSQGTPLEGAYPSHENALKYFINTQQWAEEEAIEMFYFSAFDESWKTGLEGDVGAYWGLWDKNEQLKY